MSIIASLARGGGGGGGGESQFQQYGKLYSIFYPSGH